MSAHCERVESAQNSRFKQALKWAKSPSSKLKALNLALCEGLHLAQEVLRQQPESVQQIWLPESLWAEPQWQELSALADHVEMFEVPNALYAKLSQLPSPTGPMVIFKPTGSSLAPNAEGNWVIFDAIQDPGNLGTMLRTCASAGIESIGLTPGCAWPWGEKALRAGMGAQWQLHCVEAEQLPELSEHQWLVTHLSDESVSLYDCQLEIPTVWVFGNEGQGVSNQWIAKASKLVKIPQVEGVESMNVSASCAVALFEQVRQQGLAC